jgi:hypothetical protein
MALDKINLADLALNARRSLGNGTDGIVSDLYWPSRLRPFLGRNRHAGRLGHFGLGQPCKRTRRS